MSESRVRIAYDAWAEMITRGGLSSDESVPSFDELGSMQREAWAAAVQAVEDDIKDEDDEEE